MSRSYAGIGTGVFVTNATSVSDLGGPFRTYSASFGRGFIGFTFEVSIGQNAKGDLIWEFVIMPKYGFGYGASVTAYNSNTTAWSGTGIPVFDTLNFTPGFGTNAFGPPDVLSGLTGPGGQNVLWSGPIPGM